MSLIEIAAQLSEQFGLGYSESMAVAAVRDGQKSSIKGHRLGHEQKLLDKQIAGVANTPAYKSAVAKMHEVEKSAAFK